MPLETMRHMFSVARAALAAERGQAGAIRRQADEIAFLPAVLEVLETPPSPLGRSLMWALMILFSIALACSVLCKVDVVSVAQGKIVPTGKSKVVQPLEAGIVRAILVDNGQHVTAGQTLIELDPTQVVADAEKTRMARVDAMLARARAQALLDAQPGAPVARLASVPSAPPDSQANAQRLVEGALNEYRSKLGALHTELQKREQEYQTTLHRIDSLTQTAPMARALADDYKKLMTQNYVARHAYLEKEQGRIQQEQELAGQQSYAKQLQSAIREQQQNIETAVAQFRREQLDALNNAQQQLAQLESDEAKAAQRQRQTHLTAPVTGTVQQLAVHTVGGVVTPAQELLVIVPDNAGLEIEAQILNADIGFVRPGQHAEIKLDAFPYTDFGTIEGQVMSLSQDAIKDDKLGLLYQARVRLATGTMAVNGKRIALTPGMAASVEVKTDRRRIIAYLLTPLMHYQSEALHER